MTHELFLDGNQILFNIMAHLDRLQENPSGIVSANIRTGETRNYGQIGNGGFWHCAGTADGRWIVGDTFDGSLYRIDGETGEQTLLTAGHRPTSTVHPGSSFPPQHQPRRQVGALQFEPADRQRHHARPPASGAISGPQLGRLTGTRCSPSLRSTAPQSTLHSNGPPEPSGTRRRSSAQPVSCWRPRRRQPFL